jgi:hypothetical protein
MIQTIQTYIDMGSSATKCFFWHGQPHLLHLAPQVARLNPARLDRLMLGGLTSQDPEDSAYVTVGSSAYAIGTLAIAQKGDSGLALPKRDRAVYKILATLGIIAEKTAGHQLASQTSWEFAHPPRAPAAAGGILAGPQGTQGSDSTGDFRIRVSR